MTKNNNTADERLWILKECAKMKSVKVEAPPWMQKPGADAPGDQAGN